jgi:hypothetical protein
MGYSDTPGFNIVTRDTLFQKSPKSLVSGAVWTRLLALETVPAAIYHVKEESRHDNGC